MQLRDLLSGNLETIETKVAANVAYEKMLKQNVRQLLVMENDRPVEILTERGLGGLNGGAAARQRRLVEDLMVPRVVRARSTTRLPPSAAQLPG